MVSRAPYHTHRVPAPPQLRFDGEEWVRVEGDGVLVDLVLAQRLAQERREVVLDGLVREVRGMRVCTTADPVRPARVLGIAKLRKQPLLGVRALLRPATARGPVLRAFRCSRVREGRA